MTAWAQKILKLNHFPISVFLYTCCWSHTLAEASILHWVQVQLMNWSFGAETCRNWFQATRKSETSKAKKYPCLHQQQLVSMVEPKCEIHHRIHFRWSRFTFVQHQICKERKEENKTEIKTNNSYKRWRHDITYSQQLQTFIGSCRWTLGSLSHIRMTLVIHLANHKTPSSHSKLKHAFRICEAPLRR